MTGGIYALAVWLIVVSFIRVWPCLPWQPLLKPGSRRLQIWTHWRALLLRPVFILAQPCLCSRLNNWSWTLATNRLTLPCRRLWQQRWVVEIWNKFAKFKKCVHKSGQLCLLAPPWDADKGLLVPKSGSFCDRVSDKTTKSPGRCFYASNIFLIKYKDSFPQVKSPHQTTPTTIQTK